MSTTAPNPADLRTEVRDWLAQNWTALPPSDDPWVSSPEEIAWREKVLDAGYAVLLPDPALSTGYGQDFVQRGWGAWGFAPYTDLMAATDAACAHPRIDPERTAAMTPPSTNRSVPVT